MQSFLPLMALAIIAAAMSAVPVAQVPAIDALDFHAIGSVRTNRANSGTTKYVKGTRGLNTCPPGYDIITDITECKLAAQALMMSFTTAGSWSTSPKGCLTSEWDGRNIFLNNHDVGSNHKDQARICKRGCHTVGGAEIGLPCVFPFKFRGITYNDCAAGTSQPYPWCATEVDDFGNYGNHWGVCGVGCLSVNGWSDYGEWSQWSDCPVTCGTAVQLHQRARTCEYANGKCEGSPIDIGVRACGTYSCQVESKTPMFDCYRSEKYSGRDSVVVYNGCEVDTTGGAMDVSSGIFTVQEAGTYQITFTAKFSKKVVIDLLVNDQVIADSQEDDAKFSTHTIFVEHPLNKSDKVKVLFTKASAVDSYLHSDSDRDIHFTALKVGPLH